MEKAEPVFQGFAIDEKEQFTFDPELSGSGRVKNELGVQLPPRCPAAWSVHRCVLVTLLGKQFSSPLAFLRLYT